MSRLKIFQRELEYIERTDIRKITEDVLNDAPDYFFREDCWSSSSGKYHIQTDGERENLIIHTKRVVYTMMEILANPLLYNKDLDPNNEKDLMISACILHDSCKRGLDPEDIEHTKFTHSLLVKCLVNDKMTYSRNNWTPEMVQSFFRIDSFIESHSGKWTTSNYSDVVLPEPRDHLAKLVHLADYFASRNNFNIKV